MALSHSFVDTPTGLGQTKLLYCYYRPKLLFIYFVKATRAFLINHTFAMAVKNVTQIKINKGAHV
jgi:hypothetical protein